MAKVSTYINTANKTEEAFNFYKKVFGTELTEPGFRRMGDIPFSDGTHPLNDAVKNMIMHVELPITGGHILMGTDAPEEMGFKVAAGNNMHINLEPDTREEAKRLFNALSEGGTVSMPLADMFWGAYFGSLTDKYGINWMVNTIGK
jgi:uncharacterized glyoxalase superfamily protein PhnB